MSWTLLPRNRRALPDLNQDDDSRIGSARDGSTGGTLSKLDTPGSDDRASLASLFGTLIPVSIYVAVCLAIFWILRRRCPRVYSPRAILHRFLPQERSLSLPNGWIDWIKPFFSAKDTYILHHAGLDAYLFLRYLKMLALICGFGSIIAWPILFPLHANGGGSHKEIDSLTIGNVTQPHVYYAHVVVACCLFSFILFAIYRECIFYINLRHAYLMSPYHAKRLSSRTVMFVCVPRRYLDERRIRKVFGDTVKNVWIPRDTSDLETIVKERDQTARRLEKAEIRLIKMANATRMKQMDDAAKVQASALNAHSARCNDLPPSLPPLAGSTAAGPMPELSKAATEDVEKAALPPMLPDVNGSVAAQWIPAEKRPHHRPLANYCRRVDTIKWTRNRIKLLNPQIKKLKRQLFKGDGEPIGAVFVEFSNQGDAERAYQTLAHHRPMHMSPRYIGIRPDEVVWSVLKLGWGQRIVRRFVVLAAITVAIVFWSIPAAFIGMISNISNLANLIPILEWITKLPKPIVGVIEGFLPALALTLLMMAVPWMLRGCARIMGVPSLSLLELFVQNTYFAFQVVQVFLVTTLTSAASAAITDVIKDPLSAKDLLSQSLPFASNFYISYILIQCMAAGAGAMVHVIDLFRHQVMAKRLDNPRMMFSIWNRVRTVHWGSIFPVFTNMGVIAISYSCIAPLILGFACAGMWVIYVVYRYNLMYIYSTSIDTRGLVYPKALMQLLIGLYLSEICMIGLFVLRDAFGPMVIMVIFLILSILTHLSLADAFSPLLYNLPRSLEVESDELASGKDKFAIGKNDAIIGDTEIPVPSTAPAPAAPGTDSSDDDDDDVGPEHVTTGARGIEGADNFASTILDFTRGALRKRLKTHAESLGLNYIYNPVVQYFMPDPATTQPDFIQRWLHPGIFEDFAHLEATMLPPDDLMPDPTATYPEDYALRAYWPPVMSTPLSILWIPRDAAGVSVQEVAHTSKVIGITDEGAWLGEDGKVRADMEKAPFWEPRVLY